MKLKEKLANAKIYVQQNQRKFILMMCSIVLIGGLVAGTLAWLAARTGPVINNFIGSNLKIDLSESLGTPINGDENQRDFGALLPGTFIQKDAKVTVKAGSEACWLFLQVKESATQAGGSQLEIVGNPDVKRSYKYLVGNSSHNARYVSSDWTPIAAEKCGFIKDDAQGNVYSYYYQQVSSIEEGALTGNKDFPILNNNQLYVSSRLVNRELAADFLAEHPVTITFRPVAVQLLGFENDPKRAGEEILAFKSAS